MSSSEALVRRAHRGEMVEALLRQTVHDLRNLSQVLGITAETIRGAPGVTPVVRDAVARSNHSLLEMLGRLDHTLLPPGRRLVPFDLAGPVEVAATLTTRRGGGAHVTVAAEIPTDLPRCPGIEAEFTEALFALFGALAEATHARGETTARVTAARVGAGLELRIACAVGAVGDAARRQWSAEVTRARMLVATWGGNIRAIETADGTWEAIFSLPSQQLPVVTLQQSAIPV